MTFESKTISQINDLIISQLEAQFGKIIPILPKSFIRILAKVLSSVFIILYKVAGWLFLQWFVSTASTEEITILGKKITPLIEWGKLVGVGEPDPATQFECETEVIVNDIGSILYAGTQFLSTINDVLYITQETYTLDTATKTITVIATTGGEIGNLEVGDTLTLTNTLGIIENEAAITTIITTAVDSEDLDTDYRARVKERFQLQPQGGAYADYRIWASDVPGVLQTYIYSGDIPTHVLVYVSGDPDIYVNRIPNAALLLAVAEAIEYDPDTGEANRRPLGAIIDPDGDGSYTNIKSIILVECDVNITSLVVAVDDEATVKANIKTSLTDYFLTRETYIEGLSLPPKKDKITQANLIGIVDDIVKAYSGTFASAILTINGVTYSTYNLLEGRLAKLRYLTINGVLY
jgi:hypothetical protein